MIYMVEHGFNDPTQEAKWNEWYSRHASHAFRGVPGWRSGQRFVALAPSEPKYRAMYTLTAAEVLESPEYKATTGGRFPPTWRSLITSFQRNLGDARWMPAVLDHEALLIVDPPAQASDLPGIDVTWMNVVGLDRSVARRGIATVKRDRGEQIAQQRIPGVGAYAPVFNRWTI
jgi:hypothetical protein